MKSGHDFSASTSQDIEECDSAYRNKCPKKIPENDCNFLKFQSFFGFFFWHLQFFYFIFVNGIKFLDVTTATHRKIRTEFRF